MQLLTASVTPYMSCTLKTGGIFGKRMKGRDWRCVKEHHKNNRTLVETRSFTSNKVLILIPISFWMENK